ncbi:MAG: DUF4124 domain-containing protein [Proteobacteria bacterium]|nr:DUF4124 domain-containing protein [Pseudomonadota bacterium]
MTARAGIAALLLAAALPAAAQSAYRWVDEQGRVQYSDQPPPQSIKKFEERKVQPNRGDALEPYENRKAASSFPVTLYTGKDCGKPCDDGRALLKKRGVSFSETSIETAEQVAEFKKRFGTEPYVPALAVGRKMEAGLAEGLWHSLLDDAGYKAKR